MEYQRGRITCSGAPNGSRSWNSWSLHGHSALQQSHFGRLPGFDRERKPQRRIERDTKRQITEVSNLVCRLALALRHEASPVLEEPDRQWLTIGQPYGVIAEDRVTIGR